MLRLTTACVCVYVCVRERENDIQSVTMCVWKAVEGIFIWVWNCVFWDVCIEIYGLCSSMWALKVVCMCVCIRVCVCVCVCGPRWCFVGWAGLVTGSDWQPGSPPPPFSSHGTFWCLSYWPISEVIWQLSWHQHTRGQTHTHTFTDSCAQTGLVLNSAFKITQ